MSENSSAARRTKGQKKQKTEKMTKKEMPIIDTTKDLSALFSQQARATPDAVALENTDGNGDGCDAKYTYAALDERVERLAVRLRDQGVGRDSLVGVLLGRSADYVIACLAALRAGGAMLVLELAYPPDLLKEVIDDANPAVVVTHRGGVGRVKAGMPLLVLEDEQDQMTDTNGVSDGGVDGDVDGYVVPNSDNSDNDNNNNNDNPDLDRLAFVTYSSGTTGRPKGIANSHRAAVLSYDLRFGVSDLQPGDRVACNVFFVWEILRPLLRGATVIAVPDETSYDPVALVDMLDAKRVTETLMTPTLLAAVLARGGHSTALEKRLPDLRTLWLNGEVVTTDLARRAIRALPQTRLLNCYSACETHEIACGDIREMMPAEHLDADGGAAAAAAATAAAPLYCPVGPPMHPEHTYILDEDGKPVEAGETGELFIGGSRLARGYLNRPDTTAKAFMPDPFVDNVTAKTSTSSRMYRTGDRARLLLPSGLLEISGRVGAMIKLRGYSVVPGKVENAIVAHLAVSDCAVVAHGDGLERQLVAYIVRSKENASGRPLVDINESGHSPAARRTLFPYLAHYMIPVLWVEQDELPTHTVSGKADLARLPPPPTAKHHEDGDTAQKNRNNNNNKAKKQADPIGIDAIAKIWAATLKIPRSVITPEHDFFDLGGHSLTVADLASRLSTAFGFRVPLDRLVAQPTTLSAHLETVRAVRDGHTAALQADLPAVLRADSVLDEDIQPSPSLSNPAAAGDVAPSMCSLAGASTVLLTGVTGFLGAFLLHDLLENTSARIVCLVRFKDPSEEDGPGGVARIRRHLLDLGLWRDSVMERLEVLPGNLSRRQLGLSPDVFDALAARVQVIVHAAATVNLVYPYAALRGANVGGTREVLRLACRAGATVQYVSTNGVLPPSRSSSDSHEVGWGEEATLEVDAVPEKLPDGYGQTKWVAEQLVHEAGRRGLPVRIIRAGTISGHSTTGAANAWDLLSALLVEAIHLGCAPDVEGWRAEMTPVDFVSRAVVHLGHQQTSQSQRVFHLGDPHPVDMRAVFDDLCLLGYPTTRGLGWEEWVALWTEQRGSIKGGDGEFTADILRSGMPSVDFLTGVVVLDDAATRPFLADLERPKVDCALLETYTRHWFARGWLPHPPTQQSPPPSPHPLASAGLVEESRRRRRRKGPLSGRVVVITGASSGIGAAVVTALAHEGAHVALGARRTDALEAVQRGFQTTASASGHSAAKSIIRRTDVTDRTQVDDLVQAAKRELGPVDALVACAGVMYFTLMAHANEYADQLERTVDVNCRGLLHCLSAVVPDMLARGPDAGCHIVAVSSDAGRKVFPGLGVYSASKAFVEMALQGLRLETADQGLRVTDIQPGNTNTDLLDMSTDAEAVAKYGGPSAGKILNPEDVAGAIVYALRQPRHVAVNEVMIEPQGEPI